MKSSIKIRIREKTIGISDTNVKDILSTILQLKFVFADDRGYIAITNKSAGTVKIYKIYSFMVFISIFVTIFYEIYLERTVKYVMWCIFCSMEMFTSNATFRKIDNNKFLLHKIIEINAKLTITNEIECTFFDRCKFWHTVSLIMLIPLRCFIFYYFAIYNIGSARFMIILFILSLSADIENVWRITIYLKIYMYVVLVKIRIEKLLNAVQVGVAKTDETKLTFKMNTLKTLSFIREVWRCC